MFKNTRQIQFLTASHGIASLGHLAKGYIPKHSGLQNLIFRIGAICAEILPFLARILTQAKLDISLKLIALFGTAILTGSMVQRENWTLNKYASITVAILNLFSSAFYMTRSLAILSNPTAMLYAGVNMASTFVQARNIYTVQAQ